MVLPDRAARSSCWECSGSICESRGIGSSGQASLSTGLLSVEFGPIVISASRYWLMGSPSRTLCSIWPRPDLFERSRFRN